MHNLHLSSLSSGPQQLVFVLGCQRSGTTWLANLIDASADVLLFMEPFAPQYHIMPEFPESSYFLETPSPYLTHLLQNELPRRLQAYKSLVFSRSKTEPGWFRIERWLAQVVLRSRLPIIQSNARKFTLLNLNRMDAAYPLYPKKHDLAVWAIKELRLAGKIPVLLHAFPSAHFVVIIRHPCANVQSIVQWFERGRLGELKNDLNTYLDKIAAQKVAAPYYHLIERCREGSLAQKVALYWRISYETICKQLADHPGTHLLVYEHLATRPTEALQHIFRRIEIPWSDTLDDYIAYSSSTTPEQATTNAINTVRQSETYYNAWTQKIPETMRREVLEITGDSDLMVHFEPYY
jgi:hypothetical protein